MKLLLFSVTAAFMYVGLPTIAQAQDVAPATNEDMDNFDRSVKAPGKPADPDAVADARKGKKDVDQSSVAKSDSDTDKDNDTDGKKKGKSKKKKDNFGQLVSAEAHKLKDEDKSKRKEFGKWVSSQRSQDEQRGSNSSGASTGGRGSDSSGKAPAGSSTNNEGTTHRPSGH